MTPLSLTSPRHPYAVMLYAQFLVQGIFYNTGINRPGFVSDTSSPFFGRVWAVLVPAFALVALVAIFRSSRRVAGALFAEFVGAVGLTWLSAAYVVAICAVFHDSGFRSHLSAAVAFSAFTFGTSYRAVQAYRDRGRYLSALAPPAAAVPVLAEPGDEQ